MDKVECVIVGAGVIGLAVARRLAQAGREVVVLEEAEAIGTVTSSRNSEVIHAGIYYPTGSLKARSCVAGKARLYAYCAERGIPHRRCGKLIVATSEALEPNTVLDVLSFPYVLRGTLDVQARRISEGMLLAAHAVGGRLA